MRAKYSDIVSRPGRYKTDFAVANMTAVCGMISWSGILFTYIRWHRGIKHRGIDRSTLAYRAPFQPYLSYYGFCVCIVVIIFAGFTQFSE